MADRLDEITAASQVDNYLTGTVHTPRNVAGNSVNSVNSVKWGAGVSILCMVVRVLILCT